MAFTSPTFLAVVLTLLAMGVMSGTQAKPVEQSIPVLDITTSIKLDKPIFGDKFGPFTAGQELTLICSTKASDSVSLSWWEGDTEQQSSAKVDDGLISSSFTIQTLRIEDNGRRFSCKDKQTQAIKHFEISVETDPTNVMEITKDGESIKDGAVVRETAGQDFTLICIVQGYNPLAVSWWEGGAELESVAYKSIYATSNVLSVKAITVDDSRRTFTCRSLNGQLSKTVTLEVDEEMFITQASTSGALVLTIVLLVLLVLFIFSLFVMAVLIFKYCANKKVIEGRKDEVSNGNQVFSAVVKDNSLGKVSNEKKYNKLINNSNESVSEHEEV